MTLPDLSVSQEAQSHVRAALETWTGNPRDLALAMLTFGHAVLLITDGRTDHINLYECAAQALIDNAAGEKH